MGGIGSAILASDINNLASRLYSQRVRHQLTNGSLSVAIGSGITTIEFNNLRSKLQETFTNSRFVATKSISVSAVSVGDAIAWNAYNSLNNEITILENACINYTNQSNYTPNNTVNSVCSDHVNYSANYSPQGGCSDGGYYTNGNYSNNGNCGHSPSCFDNSSACSGNSYCYGADPSCRTNYSHQSGNNSVSASYTNNPSYSNQYNCGADGGYSNYGNNSVNSNRSQGSGCANYTNRSAVYTSNFTNYNDVPNLSKPGDGI